MDHQSKGGNYQEKTMFGSVYNSNSTRSIFQVEPSNNGDDFIDLTVRHKKVNFGPKLEPFGISVSFEADKVSIDDSKECGCGGSGCLKCLSQELPFDNA